MFTLGEVVPWGRSFDEYRRMFALVDDDLNGHIIGCADGPASFNAEATARGFHVVSCDPIYRFTKDQIRERIHETTPIVLEQTERNQHEFVWTTIRSIDELHRLRTSSMDTFLQDFELGTHQGRYVDAALPDLPFADAAFDVALCSHFLFLYSEQLSEAFHLASIREMLRIAREVRIFPLLALGGHRSRYVGLITEHLESNRFRVTIERVPYEFQRGGNEMMRIRRLG